MQVDEELLVLIEERIQPVTFEGTIIDFETSDRVMMTGNSRYWRSFQKNQVLDIILKSYSAEIKSRNANEIISHLKSLLFL